MIDNNKGFNLRITLNDFELSYDDIGEGMVPIIFLHGYPFDKNMWQGQLDFLKESFRLIACDIRGFGQSKDEVSPLSIDKFANDLLLFMDKLSIEKAIICGLSMGGFIALNAIKRFPDRFVSLVLCDTQCIADSSEVKAKRYQIIKEIDIDGAEKFNEGFIKSVFCKDSFENKTELVDQLRNVVFANSEHIIKQGLVALAERFETCSSLNEISIPTLIICGREDEVTPLAQSEMMNASIDLAKLRVIENAGHVSNLEQPEIFNKHLLNFLKTLTCLNFDKVNGDKRMA
ncbi:MAG: alpha/beta hydrolase [Bacteroidota bacterium]|nr:alpha/beta hydrolase [Bacteroidota bacterium]